MAFFQFNKRCRHLVKSLVLQIPARQEPVTQVLIDLTALLFDDLCLHRTAVDSSMTQLRYAIESWFFSSSAYPVDTQTPILV